jgi:hypothetical protein
VSCSSSRCGFTQSSVLRWWQRETLIVVIAICAVDATAAEYACAYELRAAMRTGIKRLLALILSLTHSTGVVGPVLWWCCLQTAAPDIPGSVRRNAVLDGRQLRLRAAAAV